MLSHHSWSSRPARGLFLILIASLLSACQHSGGPQTTEATGEKPVTATGVRSPLDTPPHPPRTSPPTDYQALQPSFRSDADQFPNATRYRIDLVLDLAEATLTGHQHVSYTNTESVPLDSIYLRLFPNTPGYGGKMTVSDVAVDGTPAPPQRELAASALRIPLSSPLHPGEGVELTLTFALALPTEGHAADSRQPQAGYRQLGIYNGIAALASAYPIIPVYDDEGWNVEVAPPYGDAVFSDAAFFDVTITAPQTMTLAASGTCTSRGTDSSLTTWSCTAAPMRDFVALLGEDYEAESRDVDGITINSLFYAGHDQGGAAALDYASQAIHLFNRRIGPYPFAELDVVESPTLAGGIEYPGLIVINQSYYASSQGVSDRMEWVVVHEVLHQWWYSLVGNDQVDEPWLDEALVQYCTLLYYEDQYGAEVADRLRQSVFEEAYEELREGSRDQPAGLPVAHYTSEAYGAVVYRKGPLYFHSLHEKVGTEAFWDILGTYFERHRYGIARPDDWLAAVKAVTGSEYRSLYDEWIEGQES